MNVKRHRAVFEDAPGAGMGILIDEDIAHIQCVMRPSLCGFEDGPILSAEYWRRRLHLLLDSCHLTNVQLCSIDSLLLQLDRFDAEQPAKRNRPPRTISIRRLKTIFPGREDDRVDPDGRRRRSNPDAVTVPVDQAIRADIETHNGQIVRGPRAKVQRDGNTANGHAPVDEGDRRNASMSLAVAVHELFVEGLAATFNVLGAGNVLLGVQAMTLAQISGFEAWQDGIRQQLETERFDDSVCAVTGDLVAQLHFCEWHALPNIPWLDTSRSKQ